MKKCITYISFILLLVTFSCSVIYPINTQLYESDEEDTNSDAFIKIKYQQADMFQLRIQERMDFLYDDDSIPSETPYKLFEQLTTKQVEYTDGDDLVTEETYLYLENITSTTTTSSGLAFYFITYPMVEMATESKDSTSRTRSYFNNHTELFFNIVSSVQVGYWFKNSDNELLMIFKNKDKETFVIKGNHKNDGYIGLTKISHPSQLTQTRISGSQLYKDYASFNSMKTNRKDTSKDSMNVFFNKLENATPLIDFKDVFQLNGKEELLFYKLPKDKEVKKSKKWKKSEKWIKKNNPDAKLNHIILGKNKNQQKLFFEFKTDDKKLLYYFNTKRVYFLE